VSELLVRPRPLTVAVVIHEEIAANLDEIAEDVDERVAAHALL
jgi:hypothetical protein